MTCNDPDGMASGEQPIDGAKENNMSLLAEFTLFPKLPPELQLPVLRDAVPEPGVVIPISLKGNLYAGTNPDVALVFTSTLKPSGLFRACKISRDVVLGIQKGYIKSSTGSIIRFNAVHDTVLFIDVDSRYIKFVSKIHMSPGIKNLALIVHSCGLQPILSHQRSIGRELDIVAQFESLEKLYFAYALYEKIDTERFINSLPQELQSAERLRIGPLRFKELAALGNPIFNPARILAGCKRKLEIAKVLFGDGLVGELDSIEAVVARANGPQVD